MLGKAVGFIAHVLQQAKGEGVPGQSQRFGLANAKDFFLAFR